MCSRYRKIAVQQEKKIIRRNRKKRLPKTTLTIITSSLKPNHSINEFDLAVGMYSNLLKTRNTATSDYAYANKVRPGNARRYATT